MPNNLEDVNNAPKENQGIKSSPKDDFGIYRTDISASLFFRAVCLQKKGSEANPAKNLLAI